MSNEIEKVQVSDITCDLMMEDAAEELARITERTEFALGVVVQSVRTQEAIAKGKILIQLREAIPRGEFELFLARDGIKLSRGTVAYYIRAAEFASEFTAEFPEADASALNSVAYTVLSEIHLLPKDLKDEYKGKIQNNESITCSEMERLAALTEVRLAKANENLNEAIASTKKLAI